MSQSSSDAGKSVRLAAPPSRSRRPLPASLTAQSPRHRVANPLEHDGIVARATDADRIRAVADVLADGLVVADAVVGDHEQVGGVDDGGDDRFGVHRVDVDECRARRLEAAGQFRQVDARYLRADLHPDGHTGLGRPLHVASESLAVPQERLATTDVAEFGLPAVGVDLEVGFPIATDASGVDDGVDGRTPDVDRGLDRRPSERLELAGDEGQRIVGQELGPIAGDEFAGGRAGIGVDGDAAEERGPGVFGPGPRPVASASPLRLASASGGVNDTVDAISASVLDRVVDRADHARSVLAGIDRDVRPNRRPVEIGVVAVVDHERVRERIGGRQPLGARLRVDGSMRSPAGPENASSPRNGETATTVVWASASATPGARASVRYW